ncbi:MAG: sulfatase-like hydrolase/transferase, partial [Verrucomicrobiota bacterium]
MASKQRPNILWVSFEDTYPYYGCYGDKVARTPNLDKLAARGRRYTRCFSTAGVCAPARSAIITGMYAHAIGTHHMRTTHECPDTPELPTPYSAVIPHYVKCFSEYLRAEGYYCTNNEKTDYQFTPPFTAWDDCSAKGHWRNRPDPDQPFFAVFNPHRTHESGQWPENCPEPKFNPDDIEVPPYYPDTPKVRTAMARMYTHIERSDQELGELLQQLEDDGLADNTYVIHWSDHGPLPRGKRWPYDAGIRVPLIVRGPGIQEGEVCEDLISSIDLGPTTLSLAGVDIPQHLHGRAFLGEETSPTREYIHATRDRYDESYDMIRATRDKRYKYIRHYKPELPYLLWIPYRNRHPIIEELYRLNLEGKLNEAQSALFKRRPAEELYDTQEDLHELTNLAKDPEHQDTLNRLRAATDDWLKETGDLGLVPESEMVRQWYPDGQQPQTASPIYLPINQENYAQAATTGGPFKGPTQIQIHCATQGASLAYTTDPGKDPAWQLYTQPVELPPGQTTLRSKAIRI